MNDEIMTVSVAGSELMGREIARSFVRGGQQAVQVNRASRVAI